MDKELDDADRLLDTFCQAEGLAKAAATKHKHMSAAQVDAMVNSGKSVSLAKELVCKTHEWFDRQTHCDELAVKATVARMHYEQAIRRWETARSYFSAGRRVA